MAKIPLRLNEIIDSAAMREALAAASGSQGLIGNPGVHAAVLPILRSALRDGRSRAEAMLAEDKGGTVCARRISHVADEIITALFELATGGIGAERQKSGPVAVIAVGGYGRGTLAPGSDIDLLFVLPGKAAGSEEKIAEAILYMLWDLGLKVGHSTRSLDECIRQARGDATIATAILEARLVTGDASLFDALMQRFDLEVAKDTGADYVAAKLAERDERHRKAGESRYLVEPNVKDGKGGLRDLHTLYWIGKYFYRVRSGSELVGKGVITQAEHTSFREAEDFLWAVRCHMHFVTGKAEERLHFDLQREIAERLGYASTPGLSAVEHFMKDYFLAAKDVGDLTRIFCTALDEEQGRHTPGFSRIFQTFSRRRRKLAGTSDFIVDNHRISVADPEVFRRDPVNMLRLFWLADRHGLEYHPDAMKLLTRSLTLINNDLRRDKEANALFMDVLTSRRDPELNLRRMNEAGVLGRLIREFGKIVAMMQFNMYHHYTVDEHLIRCVGVLSEIEHGDGEKIHPLAHRIINDLKDQREVLYTAVLLHDIAKGRPEDHSEAGARIALKVCPAMGFNPADTATISWLIENHLLMSMTAQTRDLNDRKTIVDFADKIQSIERLKLLLVLTICDIRGVGPGVWNGWKGQLLRTLYFETELVLTGGFSETSRAARAEGAKAALSAMLTDWPEEARKAHLALLYSNYLLTVTPDDQVRHAEFIRKADASGDKLATMVRTHAFHAVTEITVLAPDHPRLLSIVAGACAAAGGNIVDAQIFTTADGRALDTILINREFERDEDEQRRGERVGKLIEDMLSGKSWLPEMIEKRTKPKRGAKAFTVVPAAEVRNTLSNRFSVIELEGLDRPGLLSEITGAISDLSLDIASAHITTFGEKIIDTFYVTDLTGQKITDPARTARISDALIKVLGGAPVRTAKARPAAFARKTTGQ